MDQWNEVCNMRTTLLQLQYINGSLSEKIATQRLRATRAHKDRLVQYDRMHEEYNQLLLANFRKILIVKLEDCLSAYASDSDVWQIIDQFITFVKITNESLLENVARLYIGGYTLFDCHKVEQELLLILQRLKSFICAKRTTIETYREQLQQLELARMACQQHLAAIEDIFKEIQPVYAQYVQTMVHNRKRRLALSIQHLKQSLLD